MTYPEVFSADGARFSIDPACNRWVATFIVEEGESRYPGCEVSRLLSVKARPGKLTKAEEKAVIKAYRIMRFGPECAEY